MKWAFRTQFLKKHIFGYNNGVAHIIHKVFDIKKRAYFGSFNVCLHFVYSVFTFILYTGGDFIPTTPDTIKKTMDG